MYKISSVLVYKFSAPFAGMNLNDTALRLRPKKNVHISPEDPRGWICTKFGTAGLLADLISHDNFLGNWLEGF